MDAEQRLVKKNKEATSGRLAMSKTSLVWLTVLALAGSFTSLNGLVINNEKVNEFIIPSSLPLKNASVDQKPSEFKNVKQQITGEDINSENFDLPTAVSSEYVAKGDKMLQPYAGDSPEKSKDKAQNYEIDLEKIRIENEKLRHNDQNFKVEVEKLRIENEKLRGNAQRSEIEVNKLRDEAHNSEVLVEKLRIDNEKSRGKAHKFEVEIEFLKISNENLKAKAHNSEVEVEKYRIKNEKLGDKAQYYEAKVEKIRIENEKLGKRAQYNEAKVVEFREKANYYEVWVKELRIENVKLGEMAQNFEVEVEKLKISNEKLQAKAQNFEVEVKKFRDEAHKLPCGVGEKVDDAENFGDDSQSSSDEAENIGEDAANAGGEAENAGDDADNSSDDADNSSHDADNSGHDADVSKIIYAAKPCPTGFRLFGVKCYRYVGDHKTRPQAAHNCQLLGGILAEPRSAQEHRYMKSLAEQFGSSDFVWTGGKLVAGTWTWDSDNDTIPYLPWTLYLPNGLGKCIAMWRHDDYRFIIVFCSTSLLASVCETTAAPAITSTVTTRGSCTGGFIREGNLCYLYVDRVETWDAAADHCRSLDAYLAEPRTQGQIDFLKSVSSKYNSRLWLGATDKAEEGKWVWAHSGAAVDRRLADWSPGQPDDYRSNEDCLEMQTVGWQTWNDISCYHQRALKFVCQKEITREQNGQVTAAPTQPADQDSHSAAPAHLPELLPAPATPSTVPEVFTNNPHVPFTGCPRDFTRIEGVCYGFFRDHKTWDDAQASCRAMGGFLAEPKSPQENRNILNLVKANGGGSPWIGASDRDDEGNWVWAHSRTSVTFTDWAVGEPNNERGREHCAHVSQYLKYHWNDNLCSQFYLKLSFVCQMPL